MIIEKCMKQSKAFWKQKTRLKFLNAFNNAGALAVRKNNIFKSFLEVQNRFYRGYHNSKRQMCYYSNM